MNGQVGVLKFLNQLNCDQQKLLLFKVCLLTKIIFDSILNYFTSDVNKYGIVASKFFLFYNLFIGRHLGY